MEANFAGKLRELREQAGLTQRQLADKAGLKYGGIRDLEQGKNGPTWDTVLALCRALGVSCEAFNQAPANRPSPGRGRPPKPAAEPSEQKAKRPRGRPKKGSEGKT